jgi:hypothetical protein
VSEPDTTPEDEAAAVMNNMNVTVDEMITVMQHCPYNDPFSRVASLLGMMKQFEPDHYRMAAAVAVERLSQFLAHSPTAGDVPNAEGFMFQLMASIVMTKSWTESVSRDERIRAMAMGIFQTCSPSQMALLSAVGMTRLIEGGTGPVD